MRGEGLMRRLLTPLGVGALALLAGCGGAGSPSGNVFYSTPTTMQKSDTLFPFAASSNGHLVGVVIQGFKPVYWDSPESAPTNLPLGSFFKAVPTAVNTSGQVIGFA